MDGDDGATSPDTAFELLRDETRLDILRVLWAADGELPFSEIRERVGNPDSGQFNYHLGRLTGHFLSRENDGYGLTQAGRAVVRAVLAGTITDRPSAGAVPIDGVCPACDGSLVARYDEHGIVECSACDTTVMWNEFPPAGLADRSPAEFARAFDRWTRARFRLAMDGICPSCAGRMSMNPITASDVAEPNPAVVHRCATCRYEARVPLFGHVLDHPAVVSFFYEDGTDVTELAYWDLRTRSREFVHGIAQDNPLRIRLTIPGDTEELTLLLDDELAIRDIDRSER